MSLRRVICGFQTGADQAGARAAKALGIATGGMMPKGWKTESGPHPEFRELYGAIESRFAGYEHRTRWNILKSDGTLVIEDKRITKESGTALTIAVAHALTKPCLILDVRDLHPSFHRPVTEWVRACEINTLNVAGHRESIAPGIGELVERFLLDVLAGCRQTQQATQPTSPIPTTTTGA